MNKKFNTTFHLTYDGESGDTEVTGDDDATISDICEILKDGANYISDRSVDVHGCYIPTFKDHPQTQLPADV